jgi:RNA polymerase sigma-70 factor (ECF subfamily)
MATIDQAFNTPEQPKGWFATTHWSVVLAAGDDTGPANGRALEALCRTYWYPLYAYVRRCGHDAVDAQDLTQDFFTRFLEKNYVRHADPAKGRFRTFLLTSMKHFLANAHVRDQAQKRGGGQPVFSLDATDAERWLGPDPADGETPEIIYDRRWAATLLERALARLEQESASAGKGKLFAELKPFLARESSDGEYAEMAGRLGMTANGVAVAVHRLRERYRELVRLDIANTVSTENEIDDELRHLLAVLSRG